ncbi:MAG: hypothetical protein KDE28_04050 [Anaerolineales bacterium]|nr:hypothetical protein [Anaerolineales bacterium]
MSRPTRAVWLGLFFCLISLMTSCGEAPAALTATPTVRPTTARPATATSTVAPSPTSQVQATAEISITPTRSDDFLTLTSDDNLLALTFPREWIYSDFHTIYLATDESLIDAPGFQPEGGLIMVYSDRNDEIVQASAQNGESARDMLNNFILSGSLNQYGSSYQLLQDIAERQMRNRSLAETTLSFGPANVETGRMYLTAIVEGERRAIVVAVAGLAPLSDYANTYALVVNSLTFVPPITIANENLPVLGFATPVEGTWQDGPQVVAVRLQPRFPALAILRTGNDTDGSLVLEDTDGNILEQADLGGAGQPEYLRLEVSSSQTYYLRIRERTRTEGNFQLLLINLSDAAPTTVTREIRNVTREGFTEYVLLAEPGQQFLIYVEPLGPEVSLQDPVVTVVDTRDAVLAQADHNYLSEAELLFFTMPGDAPEFVTVRIADFFGVDGSYQLHIHRLP